MSDHSSIPANLQEYKGSLLAVGETQCHS